ncbi:MAG: response regulator transcription factor [Saprospiraceae bacterium]|nr:response regulator transcription factor [Saprospiraceae bacterium]
MNKIKIAVLEDLKEVALMLKDTFNEQEDMVCTQIYHNAEDAMKFLAHNAADVLIVDIGLQRASGMEAIKYLIQLCPAMQFCMFTVYEDDDKIFQSLQAGAKGYILKGSSSTRILESVRELYTGGSPMSPSMARRIIDVFRNLQVTPVVAALPLTNRELELLELLSKGLLYKEIADQLGITIGTVKQHIHKIYDKLQVSNKTEAINLYKDRN